MRKEVCVVIRSVKERTEELCKKLIVEQGVPESQVFIVHEVPFAASMRKGFELGIESNCQWTYCIDADVLLRPGSMAQMLEAAQRADGMTCELQGVVYDKFFGGAREPLDNQRSGRVPGLDLSLMNSSNTDQASISLISPLWKLNLAHLGRFFAPDEHTKPPIMSCIATHAAP